MPDAPKSKVVGIDSYQPPWDPETYIREWLAFLDSMEANLSDDDTQTLEEEAEESNRRNWFRYRHFRLMAELLAVEWSEMPEIRKVVLFGEVANPLWKETPRFQRLRRKGIEIWHEIRVLDLAIWLTDTGRLPMLTNMLFKKRSETIGLLVALTESGIGSHEIAIHLFDAATDRPIGLIVKRGQLEPFQLLRNALAPDRSIVLLDQTQPEIKSRLQAKLNPAINAAFNIRLVKLKEESK